MRVLLVPVFALALLGCEQQTASVPQAPPGSPTAEDCQGDIQSFCKDVEVGEGRIANCLHEHHSQLTAGCVAFLKGPKPQ